MIRKILAPIELLKSFDLNQFRITQPASYHEPVEIFTRPALTKTQMQEMEESIITVCGGPMQIIFNELEHPLLGDS